MNDVKFESIKDVNFVKIIIIDMKNVCSGTIKRLHDFLGFEAN